MKHPLVFRMRVIWAQSFPSGNDIGATESRTVQSITPKASTVDPTISFAFPLVVYHDKDEWRSRDQALMNTFTPEMTLMMTVEGYDMLEDLDSISVRSS
jgi:hypothetical protein